MKKETPQTQTQTTTTKPAKMSPLTALIYSSAGIGLVTLITHLADVPKYPRNLGE